ncbi:MAG: hypothetical protein Q8M07_20480, partial [Prosthecobacter sp.]|nr:hypothetical protein [Prosthecobacter sp.]
NPIPQRTVGKRIECFNPSLPIMPDSSADAYPYLEEALPGFHRGRALVKAAVSLLEHPSQAPHTP